MEEEPQKTTFHLTPLTADQHAVSNHAKRGVDLPFFYLTKKKELLRNNIVYEGVDEAGHPVKWTVRPNRDPDIGVPGIDAHEIWFRLVVPVLEKQRAANGGCIPQILQLAGVRKCLRCLNWGQGGHQARRLLRGLNQIGAAWCEADFFVSISERDGGEKFVPVKGKFSRTSIYAIGEKHLTEEELASGKFDFDFELDSVIYLQLHSLEVAIQESLDRRYFDHQYMFSVEPAARNWLLIMSGKIYGVIANKGAYCEVRYSWYVKQHHTLKRLFTRPRITSQMNRVVADHIASGYILQPEYKTLNEAGKDLDVIVRYRPGPMAHKSTATIRKYLSNGPVPEVHVPEERAPRRPRQVRLYLQNEVDSKNLSELTKRGVGEGAARKLLSKIPSDRPILDLLEWGDAELARQPGKIKNPAGFYIYLLEKYEAPPPNIVSRRQAAELEAANQAKIAAMEQAQAETDARRQAEKQELDQRIAGMKPADRLALKLHAEAFLNQEKNYWYLHAKEKGLQDTLDQVVKDRMREIIKASDPISK